MATHVLGVNKVSQIFTVNPSCLSLPTRKSLLVSRNPAVPSHSKLLSREEVQDVWLQCPSGSFSTLHSDSGLQRVSLFAVLKLPLTLSRLLDGLATMPCFNCVFCFCTAALSLKFQSQSCKTRESSRQQIWLGYWIGPEDVDGWGIVEAFLSPSWVISSVKICGAGWLWGTFVFSMNGCLAWNVEQEGASEFLCFHAKSFVLLVAVGIVSLVFNGHLLLQNKG